MVREDVTIREATRADLPRLLSLLAQLNLPGTPPDPVPDLASAPYAATLAAMQARDDVRVLVAERGGEVVGTLQLTIVSNLTHGAAPWANIENMVVDGAARGSGVGAALIEAATARAEKAGCYKISLTSKVERTDAHRFYRRAGLEQRHLGFSRYLWDLYT